VVIRELVGIQMEEINQVEMGEINLVEQVIEVERLAIKVVKT
jgi:hypothetical protein